MAASVALRTSLMRTASRNPFLAASKGFKPVKLSKPSTLVAISMQMPSARFETRPFHTTTQRHLLTALPQRVNGSVNEPAPVPEPHPTHGSYHWTFERLVSIGLVPLTIAPFAAGTLNPTLDAILCATLIIHTHIGFQAVIIDYLPAWRVPKLRALFWWGLRAGTLLVGFGMYQFETNDVGLTEAIKRIWTAKPER